MKNYLESKLHALSREGYAAGPIDVSEERGTSFLESESFDAPARPSAEAAERTVMDEIAEDQAESSTKPSNEYVLNVAFFSFLGFMGIQAVFAIIANSESMLADSEAMSVDALTYLFNLCAERIKNRPYSDYERQLPKPLRERRRTMKRLYLELIPPLISVSTLIVVTVVVLKNSFVILYGEEGEFSEPEDVDVQLMLIFSGINLLLDIVNVTCFARADQAIGLTSFVATKQNDEHEFIRMTSNGAEVEANNNPTEKTSLLSEGAMTPTSLAPPRDEFYGINLNMCSAWTHVCADTMRSLAVLIAAMIATVFDSVEGETADASAAVVVSVIIIISLLPLLRGLYLTAREIIVLSRTPVAS